MRRARSGSEGTVRRLRLHSAVLENNLLGDPADRSIDVYVPGGHSGGGLPLLVDLVGYHRVGRRGRGGRGKGSGGLGRRVASVALPGLRGARRLPFRGYGLRDGLPASS